MAARFEENKAGTRAMLAIPSMVAAMRAIMAPVEAEAVRIAPVETGRYVSHFETTAGVHNGRAYGRVSNTARSDEGFNYPEALEFGTSHMRKQRIFGRALDVLNLA